MFNIFIMAELVYLHLCEPTWNQNILSKKNTIPFQGKEYISSLSRVLVKVILHTICMIAKVQFLFSKLLLTVSLLWQKRDLTSFFVWLPLVITLKLEPQNSPIRISRVVWKSLSSSQSGWTSFNTSHTRLCSRSQMVAYIIRPGTRPKTSWPTANRSDSGIWGG